MLQVHPTQTRAFVPIYVTSNHPDVIVVKGADPTHSGSFVVNLVPSKPNEFKANFWLEREGIFEVIQTVGGATQTVPLTIAPQHFMEFGTEFGLFSILLAIGLTGIYLWIRKKAGFTSSSS